MSTATELKLRIEADIHELLTKYREKDQLIQAAETHGEDLDEDFIGEKITSLEEVQETLNDLLDDLSYID